MHWVIRSLSARRAWIEMRISSSVLPRIGWSLSARRAWIEIGISALKQIPWTVALRKESVDRN